MLSDGVSLIGTFQNGGMIYGSIVAEDASVDLCAAAITLNTPALRVSTMRNVKHVSTKGYPDQISVKVF